MGRTPETRVSLQRDVAYHLDSSMPDADKHQLAARIKQCARELGFDLAGITSAQPSVHREYLRQWLDEGRHGTMHWLARRFEERTDPAVYFPGAVTVVCVAINYKPAEEETPVPRPHHGRVARYALGEDYHLFLKDRLFQLADGIRRMAPDARTRACVDTAPVMEKELAARAGIGWVGKHTLVIHPKVGSWLLLGEVMTTLDLPFDDPGIDRCGACRRCIDACPTGAITGPYQLDARRCISYLTIENRGEIDPELQRAMGDRMFGCDICQEVCPWNRKALPGLDPAFKSRFDQGGLDTRDILNWTAEDYQKTLRRSAVKRAKLPVLQRNAAIVTENEIASDNV